MMSCSVITGIKFNCSEELFKIPNLENSSSAWDGTNYITIVGRLKRPKPQVQSFNLKIGNEHKISLFQALGGFSICVNPHERKPDWMSGINNTSLNVVSEGVLILGFIVTVFPLWALGVFVALWRLIGFSLSPGGVAQTTRARDQSAA